ncbi:MAG TPA: hypothetical protein VJQ56_12375 [Blastocatellia bacterium]|nr:hypothetical protein [Blastocatellia bacterium]
MKAPRIAIIVSILAASAAGQDVFKVAPQAYKLQFDNEWVRVTRVRYGPYEKIAAHEHTPTASAYVYLNNSGPVVFKHIDADYGDVTRVPTKAGSFRLYRGLAELHEVENKSSIPSEFLRVEFKTEPVNEKSLRGKFFRGDYPPGENYQKVQFENEQIRITRLVCAAGREIDVSASASEPALLIALSPADLRASGSNGNSAKVKLGLGQERWVAANQQERLENVGRLPAEMLRFDFKTRPLSKEALEKMKRHEHPKN